MHSIDAVENTLLKFTDYFIYFLLMCFVHPKIGVLILLQCLKKTSKFQIQTYNNCPMFHGVFSHYITVPMHFLTFLIVTGHFLTLWYCSRKFSNIMLLFQGVSNITSLFQGVSNITSLFQGVSNIMLLFQGVSNITSLFQGVFCHYVTIPGSF